VNIFFASLAIASFASLVKKMYHRYHIDWKKKIWAKRVNEVISLKNWWIGLTCIFEAHKYVVTNKIVVKMSFVEYDVKPNLPKMSSKASSDVHSLIAFLFHLFFRFYVFSFHFMRKDSMPSEIERSTNLETLLML